MKIYFAGSIRSGRQDRDWYRQIIELLKNYGRVLTEHIGDPKITGQGEHWLDDQVIFKRDIEWLLEADVLVADITQPSTGVGYEIARAEQATKKVLCLFRKNSKTSLSGMINGNKKITTKLYSNMEDVKTILEQFFQ